METPDAPVINFAGQKVALGPIRRDLLSTYQRWINDFEANRFLGGIRGPMTLEAETDWYEKASRSEDRRVFTIYEAATLRPIGNTSLFRINPHWRTAEFGIFIGEKEFWGRGCGTEATRLMLDYGFNALGLHNVMLHVDANNERGRRAYRRAGFREIGVRREAILRAGRLQDEVLMECLSTEFESPLLARVLGGEGG